MRRGRAQTPVAVSKPFARRNAWFNHHHHATLRELPRPVTAKSTTPHLRQHDGRKGNTIERRYDRGFPPLSVMSTKTFLGRDEEVFAAPKNAELMAFDAQKWATGSRDMPARVSTT